jgi:hypothetical protein
MQPPEVTLEQTAVWAKAAYEATTPGVHRWVSYDPDTDTRCVIEFFPDTQTMVLAFRGTYSLTNWFKANFKYKVKDTVHEGVRLAIDVHAPIIHAYATLVPASHFVYVGHSLGGGLANEAARRMYEFGIKDVRVVTFGSLRVYKKKHFWDHYPKPLYQQTLRVSHNNDIVSRVLFAWNRMDVGQSLYFDRKGHPHQHISKWDKWKDRLLGRLFRPGSFISDGFQDHEMEEYVRLCGEVDKPLRVYLARKAP